MTFSIVGPITCFALLLIGALFHAPLVIGLFASLPFAATAIATLTALGGSTPLIYTVFTLLFLVSVAMKKTFPRDLGVVFAKHPVAWLLVILLAYVIAGAVLFPRLFSGQTNALIPIAGIVTETPLAPVSGNITQTGYFLLGGSAFFGFAILLLRAENIVKIRRGFFAFVIVHTALGWIDFGAKLAGADDFLAPIRNASYALLTSVEQSGFWRIVGGGAEASSFAVLGLGCLGFSYSYWRESRSATALILAVLILILLLLSTSSTAYVGIGILSFIAALSLCWAILTGRFKSQDLLMLALLASLFVTILAVFLYDETLFKPFTTLFQTMVMEKAESASGQERTYWNLVSLQAFIDTYGFGIGMGSSRSSSWIISTISQLGLIGTLMIMTLLAIIARGMGGLKQTPEHQRLFALCAGARACVLSLLMAETIAGSGADPGIMFFITLAVILSCRAYVIEKHSDAIPAAARQGRSSSPAYAR